LFSSFNEVSISYNFACLFAPFGTNFMLKPAIKLVPNGGSIEVSPANALQMQAGPDQQPTRKQLEQLAQIHKSITS
jgi:hypothetical protein